MESELVGSLYQKHAIAPREPCGPSRPTLGALTVCSLLGFSPSGARIPGSSRRHPHSITVLVHYRSRCVPRLRERSPFLPAASFVCHSTRGRSRPPEVAFLRPKPPRAYRGSLQDFHLLGSNVFHVPSSSSVMHGPCHRMSRRIHRVRSPLLPAFRLIHVSRY